MPLGNRLNGRSTSTLAFVIAALIATGLWARSTIHSDEPARVMGVTIWSGAMSFPSGYTVAAGQTVELNPNANTTIDLGGNLLVQGTLRSWPAPGFTHVIRFTGITETSFVGGGDVPLASDKGLWVAGAGNLDLSGTPKLAWTRAAGTLAKGATTATLSEAAAGWQVGDEVLISPTENPNVAGFSTHHEIRTLTSVSGSSVGFAALTYPHPQVTVKAGTTYGAEVVNLTRNMRIEGTDITHRTHVWIKSSKPQSVRNVAIRYVGPQKSGDTIMGRYGLHFHRSGEGSRGSLIEGVVVRQAGAFAFVPHASNGITFRNTAAFDTQSGAYWNDPGEAEKPSDTVYDRALAGYVRPAPAENPFRTTAFFLGRGDGNKCLGCVTFGVQGSKNTSGFGWPEGEVGVWTFEDSVAHNNLQDGIFTWQNGPATHTIARFVAYYNGKSGIEHGAYTNSYAYDDVILYGNKIAGIQLHAESKAPPMTRMQFARTYLDGAGITKYGYLLERPTNVDQPPVLVCQNVIQSLTGPMYFVNYTGADATVAERLEITASCSGAPAPSASPTPTPTPSPPTGSR
ncbi:MAG: hypothetical protein WEB06_15525 [Actinomycetota bacterium]